MSRYKSRQYAGTDPSIVAEARAAGYADPPGGTHGVVAYAFRINANTATEQRGTGAGMRAVLTPGVGYANGPVFAIKANGTVRRVGSAGGINAPVRALSHGVNELPKSFMSRLTDAERVSAIDDSPGAKVLNTVAAYGHSTIDWADTALNPITNGMRTIDMDVDHGLHEVGQKIGITPRGKDDAFDAKERALQDEIDAHLPGPNGENVIEPMIPMFARMGNPAEGPNDKYASPPDLLAYYKAHPLAIVNDALLTFGPGLHATAPIVNAARDVISPSPNRIAETSDRLQQTSASAGKATTLRVTPRRTARAATSATVRASKRLSVNDTNSG